MVFNSIESAAEYVAKEIRYNRVDTISVEFLQSNVDIDRFKRVVFSSQPVLVACIKSLSMQLMKKNSLYELKTTIFYTDIFPGQVIIARNIDEVKNTLLNDIKMHSRYTRMVFLRNNRETIIDRINDLLMSPYSRDLLFKDTCTNGWLYDFTDYVFFEIKYTYFCTYKEHKHLEMRTRRELDEIVAYSLAKGDEDWKKAFLAVEYCVNHWSYGDIMGYPDREYTSYGALVHHTAVCMGISLATCVIFKELGIPCKFIKGIRNGTGHAWNLVYICGGWFFIDVTDAISQGNPFRHWGMTALDDRELTSEVHEKLKCSCPVSFLQKNGF